MSNPTIKSAVRDICSRLEALFLECIMEIGEEYGFEVENDSAPDDAMRSCEDNALHWRHARDYDTMGDVLDLYRNLSRYLDDGSFDSATMQTLDFRASDLIRTFYEDLEYAQSCISEVEQFRELLLESKAAKTS